MIKEEAIKLVKEVTGMSLDWDDTHYKALQMAIKALEQEPCEDAISRRAVLNTLDKMDSVLDEDRTVETYKELLVACYNDLPPVTPTHIETVTEFADRCRECGKTAITRAENDEILNEAWSLLINVTEEDGVTTAEANGMLKLMNFFFYKYHGLKKKPDWVENVEARFTEREAAVSKKAVVEYIKASDADLGHDSENEMVVEDILNMPLVTPKNEPTEREEDE